MKRGKKAYRPDPPRVPTTVTIQEQAAKRAVAEHLRASLIEAYMRNEIPLREVKRRYREAMW